MASSPPGPDRLRLDPHGLERPSGEDGFATPAAVLISLAMATIAVAVQARAIAALHASQADYVRTQAELRLDGAQQLIDTALVRGALTSPDDAKLAIGGVAVGGIAVDGQAQPESAKLALASAAQLDASALAQLGAGQVDQVRSGLTRLAAAADEDPADLRALDPSPRWKACAPTAISGFGAAREPAPAPSGQLATAHAGEVWRTVVRDGWGWTDDRLVRVTGEEASPVRVIFRRFYRNTAGRVPCPSLTSARSVA